MRDRQKHLVPKIIAAVLAMFIPTYAAILSYYIKVNGTAFTSAEGYEIDVVQPDGSLLDIGDKDVGKLTSLFEAMSREATEPTERANTDGYKRYVVTADSGNGQKKRSYFFSASGTGYVDNGDGDLLLIPEKYSGEFLSGSYAYQVYEGSELPTLSFSGYTVVPKRAEWSYSGYRGTKVTVDVPATDVILNYCNTSSPYMAFSNPPTACNVVVYSGGAELFNGTLTGFNSISDQLTGSYTYVVSASWDRGSAEYTFTSSPLSLSSDNGFELILR